MRWTGVGVSFDTLIKGRRTKNSDLPLFYNTDQALLLQFFQQHKNFFLTLFQRDLKLLYDLLAQFMNRNRLTQERPDPGSHRT